MTFSSHAIDPTTEVHPDAVIAIRSASADGLRLAGRWGVPALWLNEGTEARWPHEVASWLERYVKWGHQCVTVASDDKDAPEVRAVLEQVATHHHRCRVDQATIERNGSVWGRHFLETLKRGPAWVTQLDRPWRGGPAFVVAAGPSLDLNGHLLREAQKRGPVIAVNTSLKAVLHHGVVPDLVVCVEAKDLHEHLEPVRGLGIQAVLDVTAHPANWDACPGALALMSHEPALVPYALELGQRPVNYGGSVACAAAAIAMLWGASPIVLVGQDLAYTGGKMYAEGTPFADMRAHLEPDGMVHFTGTSKRLNPAPVVMREAWGGGEPVLSWHEMQCFIDWYAKAAWNHSVWNATEGGARVLGTIEIRLEQALRLLPERKREKVEAPTPPDYTSACGELRRQAELVWLTDGRIGADDMPLLNMWKAPAILLACARQANAVEHQRLIREAMLAGARCVLEVLSA